LSTSLFSIFVERVGHNLGTVAVFPASNSVPLRNFTFELGLALNDIGIHLYFYFYFVYIFVYTAHAILFIFEFICHKKFPKYSTGSVSCIMPYRQIFL